MFAGFACSLWGFVRFGTFLTLWLWTGWHYRFRWLVTAFALLIVSFAAILTVPSLAVLIVAQIFFGGAIGLIYYSSLFYSMDAGDTKGEHGGIHEAAIGVGNCIGPAVGAVSLQFLPGLRPQQRHCRERAAVVRFRRAAGNLENGAVILATCEAERRLMQWR